MVRYLTTNGESAVYNPTPPFALSIEACPELVEGGEKGVLQEALQGLIFHSRQLEPIPNE